jgi:hypothetical protein
MTHDHETDPELDDVAARLRAERAVPSGAFRGELKRHLRADGQPHLARPDLRRLITAYAGGGAALIAIAAVGLVGLGPFAA